MIETGEFIGDCGITIQNIDGRAYRRSDTIFINTGCTLRQSNRPRYVYDLICSRLDVHPIYQHPSQANTHNHKKDAIRRWPMSLS